MKALTIPNLESSNHLIDDFLSSGAIHYAYQPIVDVVTSGVLAYEVLVRHSRNAKSSILLSLPMSPQHRFRLDLHGVHAVSCLFDSKVDDGSFYLLNVDAETLLSPNFFGEVKRVMSPEKAKRTLIEITSRSSVSQDDDDVIYNTSSLAEYGFRVGIDGLGSRVSNLPLITLDSITFIKLDSWVSENINIDRVAYFAASLADFSSKSGLMIMAKDVETKEQSDTFLSCGITYQQGFYIG